MEIKFINDFRIFKVIWQTRQLSDIIFAWNILRISASEDLGDKWSVVSSFRLPFFSLYYISFSRRFFYTWEFDFVLLGLGIQLNGKRIGDRI